MHNKVAQTMQTYSLISERMLSATIKTNQGLLTVFQIYAPDSSYDDESSECFYKLLQDEINKLPRTNKYMIIGDFNAKVGSNTTQQWDCTLGKFGLGQMNDRGCKLLQFCALNDLCITNTLFKHKNIRRVTWISPDQQYRNQIDFILVQNSLKHALKNCRTYNSADIGSDHNLLLGHLKLKALAHRSKPKSLEKRFKVDKLQDNNLQSEFQIRLRNSFDPLLALDPDETIDQMYSRFRSITNKVTEAVVGVRNPKEIKGLPHEIELLCEERRKLRERVLQRPSAENRDKYKVINSKVKTATRRHKRENLHKKSPS